MASVYVSGDPTKSLLQFIDENYEHDHTYIGMGCPNSWGSDGSTGSDIPCTNTGRIVRDADNEPQKNGTYYHFQAATLGTGVTTTIANANAPDTFCPLGWQLPYSGTGGVYYDKSKSWNYLFTTYDVSFNDGTTSDSTKISSYPFSYILSGRYAWGTGRLYRQNGNGDYWSLTTSSDKINFNLSTWAGGVRITNLFYKLAGFALRCNKK